MRYEPGRKAKTRGRILESAARLFRLDGFQASGVDRVMAEAGLTPGGFYAHFESKQALLAEALTQAGADLLARRGPSLSGLSGRAWIEAFLAFYLSESHRDRPGEGCPLVALVSEVSRVEGPARASFEAMVRGLAGALEAQAPAEPPGSSASRALAVVALCVGGLGLARSVQDEALSASILEACRAQASSILSGLD